MPIVIAGGPSVGDYDRLHLENICRQSFVFAVNEVAFNFPCDVVVSIDPQMIVRKQRELQELGKPIITRCWNFTKDGGKSMGLDIIPLTLNDGSNDKYDADIIKYFPLSGMLACKLSDRLAGPTNEPGRKSYVLGMDASIGHYKGHPTPNSVQYLDDARPLSKYEGMNLKNTINLSERSKISCWPKQSKLPNIDKVRVHAAYKELAIVWLRVNAAKEIFEGIAR